MRGKVSLIADESVFFRILISGFGDLTALGAYVFLTNLNKTNQKVFALISFSNIVRQP